MIWRRRESNPSSTLKTLKLLILRMPESCRIPRLPGLRTNRVQRISGIPRTPAATSSDPFSGRSEVFSYPYTPVLLSRLRREIVMSQPDLCGSLHTTKVTLASRAQSEIGLSTRKVMNVRLCYAAREIRSPTHLSLMRSPTPSTDHVFPVSLTKNGADSIRQRLVFSDLGKMEMTFGSPTSESGFDR